MLSTLHVFFVSLALVLAIVAGCGLIAGARWVIQLGNVYQFRPIMELSYWLPCGYAVTYGIFSIGYIVTFGDSSAASDVTAVITVIFGILIIPFVYKRQGGFGVQQSYLKTHFFIFILIFAVTVLPQLALGSLPFAVSDAWTHVSYINRLLISESTVVSGAWLPNEIYAIKFAPHHAFLAMIGRLTGSTAMEVWVGASFVLPMLLILSYLSFVESAFPKLTKSLQDYVILALSFVFLFRITDDLFRGTADYRIASCIILFQVARYIMLSVATLQKTETTVALFIACILTALTAITHLVEVMILLLMFVPYFFVRAFTEKCTKPVVVSMIWSTSSVVVSLIVLRLFYSGFPMPLDKQSTLELFWPFFKQMFELYIGTEVFLACVISLFILWQVRSSAFAFLVCSCAASFIFSPINPLLFGKLASFVGANLVWRTIFVFPTYLAIGAAMEVVFRQISLRTLFNFDRRTILYSVWALVAATAIAYHLFFYWHLNGTFGYQHSDSVSQLRLFPNLYRELANYKGEVVLSDTLTSAPINVVTSNYIVTHRPWTEGRDVGRFGLAKETLKHPTTVAARDVICGKNITLFVVNTASLPLKLRTETERYPWLKDDFYGPFEDYKKIPFLHFRGKFDGVDIYAVDRSKLC